MPSKDGLISHLICFVYVHYLGKLEDTKTMNLASNFRYCDVKKLNVRL